MSNNDIFKLMASTASVIVNTPGSGLLSSEVLLQNNAYKTAIQSTLRRQDTSSMVRARPPGRGRRKRTGDVVDGISDEMLQQLPANQEDVFSLFQGFNAVLPEINEAIEMVRDGKLLQDERSALPLGITPDKIKHSQNPTQLSSFKDEINYKLDLLEIKKGISSNEILEIDSKIQLLHELRSKVFDQIKRFEQDEILLESQLTEIADRLSLVKNVQVPEETDLDPSFMSKSIYGKLQKETRKTKPTLQTYYEPGSVINRFQAHEDSITCLDFDIPFGTLVTGSLDNTVRVWDLSRGRCTGLLEGHNASVNCLQLQDNILVTGSKDATLKLWNLSNLSANDEDSEDSEHSVLTHSFDSHVDEITLLNFHKNILVSGSADRTIRQWDLQTGHCLQTIDVLWASTQQNLSHSQFLSSSSNHTQIPTDSHFIGALQVYDALLATGTLDGVVRLWDLRSGEVIRQLIGHTGPVTSLAFDEKVLTTGSTDRSIRIWDLRTGSIIDSFAYDSPIASLQFDSRRIVSTNNEANVKIYDRIESRHWSCELDNIVNCLRYKDSYIVSGSTTGEIVNFAL